MPYWPRRCAGNIFPSARTGVVLEPPAQGGDCRMRFYNRDGSTAEMCGNGARCLCRHCHDRGLASGPVQRIETPAGLVTAGRIAADRYRIRLNRPSVVRLHVEAEGVRCAYLELGEPGSRTPLC